MSRPGSLLLCALLVSGLLVLAATIRQPSGTANAAPFAPATTVTLSAIYDAYTDQGDPDGKYGGLPELHVGADEKGNRRFVFLQFDVSGIPAGADISYARLRLHQQSASGASEYWVWPWTVPSDWPEESITWNTQPWPDNPYGTQIGLTLAEGSWFEWDVMPIVDEWIAKGAPAYGIVLAGSTGTVGDHVFSERSGKAAQLEIEYTAADTPGFSLAVEPNAVDLDLDPLVAGEVDRVAASTMVAVKNLQGQGDEVSLSIKGPPAWMSYTFKPASGNPSFESQLVLSVSRSALPEPGEYPVIIQGTTPTESVQAELTVRVLRTLYGDLIVTGAEAVQVVESRILAAHLIRNKATAFKVNVTSSFPRMINVYFRLGLPPTEWDAPLIVMPPAATGAAAAAPIGLALTYPEVWGPYQVYPGDNSLWLPYVADANARVDLTTNPAGVIAGQCRGGSYSQCTIDTRHAPRPIAPTVHFTVAADPGGAIVEQYEGNNSYSEPGWPAVITRPWRFYFIPTRTNSTPRRDEVGRTARHLVQYLVANFPIADTKVSYSVSYGLDTPAANEGRGVTLSRILALARSENYDYAIGATTGCGGGGTLPGVYAAQFGSVCIDEHDQELEWPNVLAHEFAHSTTDTGDTYSLDTLIAWEESYCEYVDGGTLKREYCVYSNTPIALLSVSPYCTQASRNVPASCSGTITKELFVDCHCSSNHVSWGQACRETPPVWMTKEECSDACEVACDARGGTVYGAPDNRTEHPAGAGMWVNKWVRVTSDLNSFMDSHWPAANTFPFFWQTLVGRYSHVTGSILNDGWVNLTNSARFRRSKDPEALLVSGSVTAGGTATFQPFLRLPEALLDLEPGSTGAYELRLVGAGGAVLSSAGFDLSFEQTDPFGGPVDESPFVYRIEWVAGTQAVELWSGGQQLARRVVSANAPKLTLLSPQGGGHWSGVHVSWAALDDDGDALTFALSVSSDGGETWNPVALNLTGDSYELSLDSVPPGINYRLKLRATDGVNTTQVISQPFAVTAAVYLPLMRR